MHFANAARVNGEGYGGQPTHAWLRDPTSGIIHLVRAKDGHACCAPSYVKAHPSGVRWQPDEQLELERRCTVCQQWLTYYVGLQQQQRAGGRFLRR